MRQKRVHRLEERPLPNEHGIHVPDQQPGLDEQCVGPDRLTVPQEEVLVGTGDGEHVGRVRRLDRADVDDGVATDHDLRNPTQLGTGPRRHVGGAVRQLPEPRAHHPP